MPKFPEVEVQLSGEDGNVFSIIARVSSAMRRHGIDPAVIDDFTKQCFSAEDYDAVIQLCMEYVEVL